MKKKILYGIAVLVIATIMVFNVNIMMNDGIEDNSIKLIDMENLVATAQQEANNVKQLPKKTERVRCVVVTQTTTTTGNNNSANSGWSAGGSVNAGYGPIGGSAYGNYNSGSSSGNSSSTTTTTTTTQEFWADKIICYYQNQGSCNPYNPCK